MRPHSAPRMRGSWFSFGLPPLRLLGFMLAGYFTLSVAAQDNAVSAQTSPTAQAQNTPAIPSKTSKSPDVSKEALAWDKLTTRYRFEADGTGTREITAVVRVLADAGVKQMAVLTFTYTSSNQQVDIGYVRVKK